MPNCTYESVRQLLASLAGEDATALNTTDETALLRFINRRLRLAWDRWDWPEAMRTERRAYRRRYADDLGSIAAGTELYFPPDGKYYLCIRAVSAGPTTRPAALTGGAWVVNTDYWAVCGASYSGDDWADATAYAVGDVVRSIDFSASGAATSGEYFVCHTAHTSSTAFDGTKFGRLIPFEPYIAYAQTGATALGVVRGVYRQNPDLFPRARRVAYTLTDDGVMISEPSPPAEVWVRFRARVTEMTGTTSQDFPLWLRTAVATGAYADWLRADRQHDKALVEDEKAEAALAEEVLLVAGQAHQNLRYRIA